jgi:hypothetical protein
LALHTSHQDIPLTTSDESVYRDTIPENQVHDLPSKSRCFSAQEPISTLGQSIDVHLQKRKTSLKEESIRQRVTPLSPPPPSSPNTFRYLHSIPHRFSLILLPTRSKCKVCSLGFKLTSRHLVCDGMFIGLFMF